jgi:hypothetical protein
MKMTLCYPALSFTVMLSAVCLAAAPPPTQTKQIDAATFAIAFRDGQSDKYKGFVVTGQGAVFHGATSANPATTMVLTIGALSAEKTVTPLLTWEAFKMAEADRSTLVFRLFGTALPGGFPSARQPPSTYEFLGTFTGEMVTMGRTATASTSSDLGPCPGADMSHMMSSNPNPTYFCVPILRNATVASK